MREDWQPVAAATTSCLFVFSPRSPTVFVFPCFRLFLAVKLSLSLFLGRWPSLLPCFPSFTRSFFLFALLSSLFDRFPGYRMFCTRSHEAVFFPLP
jgi:hypothetical protein